MAWKFLNFAGLQTLSGIIKGIKTTADDNTSAVADLGKDVQALAGNVAEAVEELATARQAFTLETSGWAADSSVADYPYKYTFALAVATADSRVDAVLSAGSQSVAAACHMCTTTETAAGSVTFRAKTMPTGAISGQLYITETEG